MPPIWGSLTPPGQPVQNVGDVIQGPWGPVADAMQQGEGMARPIVPPSMPGGVGVPPPGGFKPPPAESYMHPDGINAPFMEDGDVVAHETLPPGPGYEDYMDKASREYPKVPDAADLPFVGEHGSPEWKANQQRIQAGSHMESTNGSMIPIPPGLNLSHSDMIGLRAAAVWHAPAGQRTQHIQDALKAMKPTDADRYARAVREQKFSPKD